MLSRVRFLLLLAAILAGGTPTTLLAASKPVSWVRGIYVAESPAPLLVPRSAALIAAREQAQRAAGSKIVTGAGQSMEPLYASGTLMVVAPAALETLKRGQTVVYRNRENLAVAHVLVAKCRDGWRVAGLNNPRHDGEGVTGANLLGVVIAAVTPVADRPVALLR